jgi:alkanesulfonate monooxygenase SsuD/methylene tetrahydromethanopterin reductase-like flavin-dependent oxidoreductase (luciferase family)
MPVHPIHRNWAETLKEDREAIILADRLGFYDAFMGEHLTDKAENVTNSLIFNASLISDTKTIKLATGTSNLSHMHPVLVAQQAALFDRELRLQEREAALARQEPFQPMPRPFW